MLLGLAPASFPRVVGRDGRLLLLEALEDHRRLARDELLSALERPSARWSRRSTRATRRAGVPTLAARLRAAARTRIQLARDLRASRARACSSAGARRPDAASCAATSRAFGLRSPSEMDDLHKANFMLRDADGDLRYVDEEGVAVRPLFTSLASLLKTADAARALGGVPHGLRLGRATRRASRRSTPSTSCCVDSARKVANKLRSRDAASTPSAAAKLPAEIDDLRRVALRSEPSLDFDFYRGP